MLPGHFVCFHGDFGTIKCLLCKLLHIHLSGQIVGDGVVMTLILLGLVVSNKSYDLSSHLLQLVHELDRICVARFIGIMKAARDDLPNNPIMTWHLSVFPIVQSPTPIRHNWPCSLQLRRPLSKAANVCRSQTFGYGRHGGSMRMPSNHGTLARLGPLWRNTTIGHDRWRSACILEIYVFFGCVVWY